jgi:hypothetical protein
LQPRSPALPSGSLKTDRGFVKRGPQLEDTPYPLARTFPDLRYDGRATETAVCRRNSNHFRAEGADMALKAKPAWIKSRISKVS